MALDELLTIMQNRLLALNEARKASFNAGDLERIIQIDHDITTTQTSIDQPKKTLGA